MSRWENAHKKWNFESPGLPKETGIWVSGAVDMEENQKHKLLIEERADNQGYSLQQPGVLEAAIKNISDDLNIQVDEVEWYAVGEDDQLYSIDVSDEMVWRPSPQWQALANSQDLNRDDLEKARKVYPDELQRVITTQWSEPDFDASRNLVEAFGIEEASPELAATQEREHSFDLSKEFFNSRAAEPTLEPPMEFEFELEQPDSGMSPEP